MAGRRPLLNPTLASLTALLLLAGASAHAETDPRIIERYRQMLAANPVEGTAMDRLWKIAQQDGTTEQLLDGYRDQAAKGDFVAQLIWAHLLHRAGREDESREALRHAAEMNPKSPLPHLALAKVLPPAEAAQEFEAGVALLPPDSPTFPDMLQQLGDAWMAAGKPEKAADAWEKMVTFSPDNLDLRKRLADIYAAKGMTARAATHYAYLEQHGDPAMRAGALRALAKLYQSSGDIDSALDALQKAMALTAPGNWLRGEIVEDMIRYSQRANHLPDLETRWKKEAEKNPRSATPWLQLADLYEREGNLISERDALQKAAALAPGDASTKLKLAHTEVRLDDVDAAAAQLDGVLAVQPKNVDVVLERAELDIRRNNFAAARGRLDALASSPTFASDETVQAKVTNFFQQHRMYDALEARLRQSSDPVPLAEFLFAQHRTAEAKAALKGLVRPADSVEAQAAAHQQIADVLKEHNDLAGSVDELEQAAKLQPDSRALQLAYGDALLNVNRAEEARAAYQKALDLSSTPADRVDADQHLFRSFQITLDKPASRPERPLPETTRAVADMLSLKVPEAAPQDSAALDAFIADLEKKTQGSHDAQPWLRLARWQYWSRNLELAKAAVMQAITLAPDDSDARELAVSIATAAGDRTTVLGQLHELIQIAPDRKELWEKQIAQTELQLGQYDDAIKSLSELAQKSGEPAAVADLANAQQQADRWSDALATWQLLYSKMSHGARHEYLQPLLRAMQHLEMNQQGAELLWNALDEQPDENSRSTVLHDLITHCQQHGMMQWLLEKLQIRCDERPDDTASQLAFAEALKADGHADEAYKQFQLASASAPDRANAEGDLVQEAEKLRNFVQAAKHQRARITLLPSPSASEWLKLAQLQEWSLDYAGADATWQEVQRRFPRDSDSLLQAARYYIKWGAGEKAYALTRAVHGFDPENLEASVLLARLAAQSGKTDEARDAYEAVLKEATPPKSGQPLELPPEGRILAVRLQAYLGGLAGGTVLIHPDGTATGAESEYRLEAIRYLAGFIDDSSRAAWIQRWKTAKSDSEILWSLYYSGAHRETFAFLKKLVDSDPTNTAKQFALMWCGLRQNQWQQLANWLWSTERTPDDYESFHVAIGEWCTLNEPLDTAALFENGAPGHLWNVADVLASHHRLRDAIAVAQPAFDKAPAPRGAAGLSIANWNLAIGDVRAARAVLKQVAKEPADSLDAPAFAALRALFLLTPEPERAEWADRTIASIDNDSPVYKALAAALLQSLTGNMDVAKPALEHLVTLRAVPVREASSVERVWSFLLTAGIQFQLWHLDDAAEILWTRALQDEAAIQLQGDRAMAYASEIRMRLAACKLVGMGVAETNHYLEDLAGKVSLASFHQLAGLLDGNGAKAQAVRVLAFAQQRDATMPIARLIAACAVIHDNATAEAAIERSIKADLQDPASVHAIIDFVAATDRARALKLATDFQEKLPNDPLLLEKLAKLQVENGQTVQAEQNLRRLVFNQPANLGYRISLSEVMEAQGDHKNALSILKTAPHRGPDVDVHMIRLLVAAGKLNDARLLAAEILHGENSSIPQKAAKAFVDQGHKEDGLALLASAVDTARDSHTAFKYQKQLLELLGPNGAPELKKRWLLRLRKLASAGSDLMSSYFDLTRDPKWQAPDERKADLLEEWNDGAGSAVAGAWLVSDLLEANQPDAAREVLRKLLARHDMENALLTFLDDRCKQVNRQDMALEVSKVLLERAPDDLNFLIRRARSLHALGRDDDGSTLMESAAARTVFAPQVAATLASAALELGYTPLARQMFESAVAADPAAEQTDVYLGYVRLLLQDSDFTSAKRMLRESFRNPANHEAQAVVDYLRKSGRPAATEVRDLELRPEVAAQVEKLMND